MKVVNIRSGIYHYVAKELGNSWFKTLCGKKVRASKHYTGTEKWVREIDAWDCNCLSCNRIRRKQK